MKSSTTKNSKGKTKTVRKLDDYEASAKAGICTVGIEQKPGSKTYFVRRASGKDITVGQNLTAEQLIKDMSARGVQC